MYHFGPIYVPVYICMTGIRGGGGGGGQTGSYPGRQPIRIAKLSLGLIENVELVTSGFHTRKNFSENYQNLRHTFSKIRHSCPRTKMLKKIGFDVYQIIGLPAAPIY
jgi:hypothetical protein